MRKIDVEEYSKATEYFSKNPTYCPSRHEGKEFSEIFLQNLIRYSEDIVRIYTTGLSGDLGDSDKVCDGIADFLEKPDTKLHLLHTKDAQMDSKSFDIIKEKEKIEPERIKIKEVSDEFSKKIKDTLVEGESFTLGDSEKFRIETDSNKLRAVGNFKANRVVRRLAKIFDYELGTISFDEYNKPEKFHLYYKILDGIRRLLVNNDS